MGDSLSCTLSYIEAGKAAAEWMFNQGFKHHSFFRKRTIYARKMFWKVTFFLFKMTLYHNAMHDAATQVVRCRKHVAKTQPWCFNGIMMNSAGTLDVGSRYMFLSKES